MTTAPTSLPHRPPIIPIWLAGAFVLALIAASIVFAVQREAGTRGDSLEGSGVSAAQVRNLDPFSAVELAGANTVWIDVGSVQRVAVQGDDNLLDRVVTTVSDGVLAIDNRLGFRTHAPMTVRITVPTLNEVTLSGSGTIMVVGVKADAFTVRLPGAGTIEASGRVDRVSATLEGTGTMELAGLAARDAVAAIGGSGAITLSASGSLDANIAGTGSIEYSGSPSKVTRRITGTGSIVG